MINRISFTGKGQPVTAGVEKAAKKVTAKINEYVAPGKIYSPEEFKAAKEMAAKDNVTIAEKVDEYMGPGKVYAKKEIDAAKAAAAEVKAKAAERASIEYASPFATTASKAEEKVSVEYASPFAQIVANSEGKEVGKILNVFG